ncbi:MAG: hypothetical protein O2954_12960 [bacterium]|nr:hypothetical protein [bacterium]
MNYEVLVILFLILSVISSLINKVQESRRKKDQEVDRPSSDFPDRGSAEPVDEEEEIDLSEWEIFPEPEPPRPLASADEEYREVTVRRPVSERDTGEEYREVRGARPVTEAHTGLEFREVTGKRPVFEPQAGEEYRHALDSARKLRRKPLLKQTKRRNRIRLNFKRDTLQKVILYNEIIGPPRAERMPW